LFFKLHDVAVAILISVDAGVAWRGVVITHPITISIGTGVRRRLVITDVTVVRLISWLRVIVAIVTIGLRTEVAVFTHLSIQAITLHRTSIVASVTELVPVGTFNSVVILIH